MSSIGSKPPVRLKAPRVYAQDVQGVERDASQVSSRSPVGRARATTDAEDVSERSWRKESRAGRREQDAVYRQARAMRKEQRFDDDYDY